MKIFSRIVSWGGMRPLNDSGLAATSRKPPEDQGGHGEESQNDGVTGVKHTAGQGQNRTHSSPFRLAMQLAGAGPLA